MNEPEEAPVTIIPARTGRHRTPRPPLRPGELVRVEVRMPAADAARLYRQARDIDEPVSRTATLLIVAALDALGGEFSA